MRPLVAISTLPVLLFVGILILNGCGSPRAAGVQADGKLAPCPSSPNCVCSQDPDDDKLIDAITYTGAASDAHRRLLAALAATPRTAIVVDSDTYIHATATTLIMRFTDDLEFLINDAKKKIEVRSLSRVGYSDLGTNRRRIEALRETFAKTP